MTPIINPAADTIITVFFMLACLGWLLVAENNFNRVIASVGLVLNSIVFVQWILFFTK